MTDNNENKNKHGGARPGAGRKKTGLKTKNYTIHLPLDIADEMEKRAAGMNKTVNRYIRDIIELSGKYSNVSLEAKNKENNRDEVQKLEENEEVKPYERID